MNYLNDLEQLIKINSYTKNKQGVDEVSKLMSTWLEELNFSTIIYERENIGNHILFKSTKTTGTKILLLGHNDTVFHLILMKVFQKMIDGFMDLVFVI